MRKIFILSLIICILISACGEKKEISTRITTNIPESSNTVTTTATSTPTITHPTERPSIPTNTPFPTYQNKNEILNFYIIGDHSYFDSFIDTESIRSYSRLVIYDDGQVIIAGETYKQKILSSDEIDQFLSDLESLGFYSIETNHKHDPTDKLYDYGDNYQESLDGRFICIMENTDNDKNVCVYEPDIQYLIPKMESILKYLDNYQPEGLTPYIPDRLLVWIERGRNPYDNNLPETAIPWDEHLPSLETSEYIIFVDGELAKEIYLLFENPNDGLVFSQNGNGYTLRINIVFPHEKMINPNL